MEKPREALDSETARMIADMAENTISLQPDLEWWSILLESLYGWSPTQARAKQATTGQKGN